MIDIETAARDSVETRTDDEPDEVRVVPCSDLAP